MAKHGKTISTLVIGVAAGIIVGFIIASDRERRAQKLEKIRVKYFDIKNRLTKQPIDLEADIYNA